MSHSLLRNDSDELQIHSSQESGGHSHVDLTLSHIQQVRSQSLTLVDDKDVLNTTSSSSQNSQSSGSGLECPICLQSCIHPVELPCRHIFCFLCIKGVVTQGGPQPRCAICRQDVPSDVLTNPMLKDVTQLYKGATPSCGFLWYYESRGGGWWEYDERTMQELERAYETKQISTQLLIAGHLYEIDFGKMIQFRIGNPNLFRRIKRDVPRSDKRGIAGIRVRQGSNSGSKSPHGTKSNTGAGTGTGTGEIVNISGAVSGPSTSVPYSTTYTTGSRRTRGSTSRTYHPTSTIMSVIDAVASNSTSSPVTPTATLGIPGNSVTFFIPHAKNNISGIENADAETESDCDDDNDSLDDDEDMEFGEDGSTTEEEYYDNYDGRDGARAPTSRSDRSTSSSNHNRTPPPADNNDVNIPRSSSSTGRMRLRSSNKNGNSNVSSRTTPVDVNLRSNSVSGITQSGFPFSPTPTDTNGGLCSRLSTSTPTSPIANVRIGGLSVNTPMNPGNNNGTSSTCIQIGSSLRITVDYDGSTIEDEVL